MSRKWLIIGGVVVLVAVLATLLVTGTIPGLKRRPKSVQMEFWGVDDERVWREIISDYQKENLGVKINYRQLSANSFETDLVNALASGQGPDVIMFQHNWLPKHANKLAPADPAIFSAEKLRALFPTVVEQDFAPFGVVHALPLYIDTLSLIYNRDIFDQRGVALPPRTWNEFTKAAQKLGFGRTAIGGSGKTIDRVADIISLLMLQDGVQMTDEQFTRAIFARNGLSSLVFYLNFGNKFSPSYIWNDERDSALEGFAAGRVGMIFGYRYHVNLLRQVNPFLNIEIASPPQLTTDKIVNHPFYHGLAVTAASPYYEEAWKFIGYATTNRGAVMKYLGGVGQLPALRTLIDQVGNTQALSARSWLQVDNRAIDQFFSEMVQSVFSGKEPSRALTEAEEKINRLMKQ